MTHSNDGTEDTRKKKPFVAFWLPDFPFFLLPPHPSSPQLKS